MKRFYDLKESCLVNTLTCEDDVENLIYEFEDVLNFSKKDLSNLKSIEDEYFLGSKEEKNVRFSKSLVFDFYNPVLKDAIFKKDNKGDFEFKYFLSCFVNPLPKAFELGLFGMDSSSSFPKFQVPFLNKSDIENFRKEYNKLGDLTSKVMEEVKNNFEKLGSCVFSHDHFLKSEESYKLNVIPVLGKLDLMVEDLYDNHGFKEKILDDFGREVDNSSLPFSYLI